jgi:uncharacterized protein
MGRFLTLDDVEDAVRGGSIFAAGGGGWPDHGRMLGTTAVSDGPIEFVSMTEVPDDAWVATAAAIGAPAGTTPWEMRGEDYVRAVELLQDALGEPLFGLIIGQNGMSSTLNAWLPAARLGLKVIDAVGDIRAHPTGDMGSLGMAARPDAMIQTAAGGHRASDRYIELVVRGATAKISPVLRTAADMSGGFIASCRNPLRGHYVREHAALGGISRALALGAAIRAAEDKGPAAVIAAICGATRGTILAVGTVVEKSIVYSPEAFDIGTITLETKTGRVVLHVMNEYMAVEDDAGGRLASFPDVIATLDNAGAPVSVGRVQPGMRVQLLHIDKSLIPLSSSVRDPSVYPAVERALGLDLVSYALA